MSVSVDPDAGTDRAIAPRDPLVAGVQLSCAVSAKLLSPGGCAAVVRGIAGLSAALQPGKMREIAGRYAEIAGPAAGMPAPARYARTVIDAHVENEMLIHRLAERPGWRPSLAAHGAEAVDAALAAGSVVIWLMPFEFCEHVVRLVAEARGWPYRHLRHWAHGPSSSAFGRRFLNPRYHRVEDGLCGRAIALPPADARPGVAEIDSVLASGGMVGFRGLARARRPAYYPFLAGHIALALGAPAAARRNGAALFAAATRRTAPFSYSMAFEPLAAGPGDGLPEIGARFVRLMEDEVRHDPSLWSLVRRQCRPGPPPDAGTEG